MKKWTYFMDRDELRYAGRPHGRVVAIIETEDIEIYINEDGEINEIAVYNASKHIPPEDIEKIADTTKIEETPKPQTIHA